ncbi:MAG: helix-turn-helix domain-containing protein [Thermoleophilia bacterium]
MATRALSPDRLREARDATGMNQREAARRAGISRGTLQNAETGRCAPHADALVRLADLYGVALDDLFVHEHRSEPDLTATANPPPS